VSFGESIGGLDGLYIEALRYAVEIRVPRAPSVKAPADGLRSAAVQDGYRRDMMRPRNL
jgi:hypothetical protein